MTREKAASRCNMTALPKSLAARHAAGKTSVNLFFYHEKHKMTRKKFMESRALVNNQRRILEFFSCYFVLFVVKKEIFS